MHPVGERERGSKVYPINSQSIPMSNDRSHERINQNKVEETKHVQQRKQIDKILRGIVKERMFGNFLNEETRISAEQYYNIDMIHRNNIYGKSRGSLSRTIQTIEGGTKRRPSISQQLHNTIELSTNVRRGSQNLQITTNKKRNASQRLPQLKRQSLDRSDTSKKTEQLFHAKKLQINEKVFSETFRKWAGGNPLPIYELKVSREAVVNRFKHIIDSKLLERFFHFFGFPQSFGLRQFCNLMENAANCNLKFIDFWVFSLLDQNSNGILTSQDFFQFLQRFSGQNFYVEEEVYQIQSYFRQLQLNFKPREQRGQALVEQVLVINPYLRLEQLKDLLKQSGKQRIDVDCVKSTCYHQTVMSLEHDPLERLKQSQIETNELVTRKIKDEMTQNRKKLQHTPGIRLRDFYLIYKSKRPKIFCFFINLLTGERAQDYE